VLKELYNKTVFTELNTLLEISHKHIIPNAFSYLNRIKDDFGSEHLQKYSHNFKTLFEHVLKEVHSLE